MLEYGMRKVTDSWLGTQEKDVFWQAHVLYTGSVVIVKQE
jgi:hypothetical protein